MVENRKEIIRWAEFVLHLCTCLLAHVKNPEIALTEMKRVVRAGGGQIVIGLPADPGMFNRLVKNVVTYPKMIRLGIENQRLEYAREHINGVGNLLEMINFHFSADLTNFSYYPFRLASWNLSLGIIVNIELR